LRQGNSARECSWNPLFCVIDVTGLRREHPSMPRAPTEVISRNALVVIAVVVAGGAIYWLRGILTPLALAIFLMIMIDSFVRVVQARASFLPKWAAMPLALVVIVALFGLAAVLVADNATSFMTQVTSYEPKLNGLLQRIAGLVGVGFPASVDQLLDKLNPVAFLTTVTQGLREFAANALFVLVYLGFLIASRSGFDRKAVRLFPEREERHRAMGIFQRIRNGVERYLWIQTVTGAMIAVACWAIMAAVGLDNAFFWAFLIFVAGYIPVIGGVIAGVLPPIFALVQFDTFWQAIVLLAVINAINFIVGNIVLPRMQGDSLNLDPVAVLLALAFWGVIWGLPGMFLSTPLTVMTMILLAQFPGSMWLAVLISGDGNPLRDDDLGPEDSVKARRPPH
jgi:predicted PurR-regulated permease PerM